MLNNKTILITGGTGSFGNAALKHFIEQYDIKEIRVFSRDENKQHDMRTKYDDPRIKYFIGDIREKSSIMEACAGANYVFHAAALKQVPSCEFHPLEAVRTNVIGTDNVISAAIENKVECIVCLSTDKAVHPVNAMGMTKALLEKVAIARSRSQNNESTRICCTRYGNVMASRGSVIPHFLDQIFKNQPITVTDPEMTRFLMPLEESIELVKFAFLNGRQGDIFVQKTDACRIGDLAKVLLELFESKLPVNIIGTRHGEKKHESLLSQEEMRRAEDMGRYYRVAADNRDLNYSRYFNEGQKPSSVSDYSSDNTTLLTPQELKKKLLDLQMVQDALKSKTPN
jgi:UDP-N-acetylglucosamine 4,6-dehydratase